MLFFWGHFRGCTELFLLLCPEVITRNPLFFELCQNFLQALGCSQLESRMGWVFFSLRRQITKSKKNHPGEKNLAQIPTSISQGLDSWLSGGTKGWCQSCSSKPTSRCHQAVEGRLEELRVKPGWGDQNPKQREQNSSLELSAGKIALL